MLSISYRLGILNPREADDKVALASHCVSFTVPVPKLGEVVVACFGIICEDTDTDSGVRNSNTHDIERGLRMMLSVAHITLSQDHCWGGG